MMTGRTARGLAVCVLTLLAVSCREGADQAAPPSPSTGTATAQPPVLPDLTHAEEGVREQAGQLHAALLARIEGGGSDRDLAAAYGELAMFLHASEYLDAALPYYTHAERLAPDDVRWPYGQALALKARGHSDEAIEAFRRALAAQPDHLAAMIWLARLYLDQGRPDAAAPLLTRAQAEAPRSVPVLAGLGQVAVAMRRYDEAVRYFEEALVVDPGALSLHAPLANAYRALGRADVAEAHVRKWRNRALIVPDPFLERLESMVRSGLSYEMRGLKAMQSRDWKTAEAIFREGLLVAPAGSVARRSLHHKLGTVLYLGGNPLAAVEQFREVLRSAPADRPDDSAARANYSLGVIMASGGRSAEAIDYLLEAVKYRSDYGEAHLALADAFRRLRRFENAATHYQEAMRITPAATEPRFGYAVTLVHLERFVDAREVLVDGLRAQPDEPALTQALARILATSPDPRARDGRRAVALAQQLAQKDPGIDVGETLAMALAEAGDYGMAVSVQKDVMAAAAGAGLKDAVTVMAVNLRRYERQMPSRTPWAEQDPVNRPGPPVTPELVAVANAVAARR